MINIAMLISSAKNRGGKARDFSVKLVPFFFFLAVSLILKPVVGEAFSRRSNASVQNNSGHSCELKFGAVPQFGPRKLFLRWNPLLVNLQRKLRCKIIIVGAKSINKFESNFKRGVYDIAYMNPYHSVIAADHQGYETLLRSGTKNLQGILVVAKDSQISNPKDLDGQTLVFPSRNSFGATLVTKNILRKKYKTNVKSKYVKTHGSAYLHVAKNLAIAGGGILETFQNQSDLLKSKLRILFRSKDFHSHPLVVHPRVGKELKKRISQSLIELSFEKPDLFSKISFDQPVVATNEEYLPILNLDLDVSLE